MMVGMCPVLQRALPNTHGPRRYLNMSREEAYSATPKVGQTKIPKSLDLSKSSEGPCGMHSFYEAQCAVRAGAADVCDPAAGRPAALRWRVQLSIVRNPASSIGKSK
jgi:hypothetical protein